jgi:acyl-CoA reductase-like NAD-dependent aldehyde dehydrogenase
VRSGSVCVNDVLKQAINHRLPFGGIGPSGHGHYRGRYGFDTFSHLRPITRRPQWPDPFALAPPYGNRLERLRKLLR